MGNNCKDRELEALDEEIADLDALLGQVRDEVSDPDLVAKVDGLEARLDRCRVQLSTRRAVLS